MQGSRSRALYSNRGWREENFENVVFEPVWRGTLFQVDPFIRVDQSVPVDPSSGLFIQTAAGAKKKLKTLFLSPFGAENFFK